MRRLLAFVLTLSLVMALTPALAAMPNDMDDQIDQIFRRFRTVGASIVIAKDGQVIYQHDYGFKDQRRRVPVDERTFFKLSCVTKLVTSLGVMQLVEQGKIELDRDISDYFGYPIENPNHPGIPITPRQLLSHTSSLSMQGGYSRESNTVRDMLDKNLKRPRNFEKWAPGSTYRYSNFSSGLVGSIMEKVTGQSVNSYMKENVFKPLGVDAGYRARMVESPDDISFQYAKGKLHRTAASYLKDPYSDVADPENNYRITVGGLWIRSRDLIRYAIALCGDGSVDGVRLISPESVKAMRAVQQELGKSVTGPSIYGLFLERTETVIPGKVLYGHQGMGEGAMQNCYFDPETGFVFVVLTNGMTMSREQSVSKLAKKLINFCYPLVVDTAAANQ